ncbi:hypothetical protein BU23DRAFT_564268 [Bimuria novae-zelandiae CBS 107.79]|uniref:Uncharacterized protein n=1 Tax=Bimuria novae-zelandiae CBS 107.79 TaxID=1447943 RepID=A0A6A5VLX7_9PLEO|nr:hypothetical protein BU23DRAFT_564268 [Bimuria novae-zelandiae CBS 107.79]
MERLWPTIGNDDTLAAFEASTKAVEFVLQLARTSDPERYQALTAKEFASELPQFEHGQVLVGAVRAHLTDSGQGLKTCIFTLTVPICDGFSQRLRLREMFMRLTSPFPSQNAICEAWSSIALRNPNYVIERHIGFPTTVLPVGWFRLKRDAQQARNSAITGHEVLSAFIPWVEDAAALRGLGMPESSHKTILSTQVEHGGLDPAWALVIKGAQIYDAFMEGTSVICARGCPGDIGEYLCQCDLHSHQRRSWSLSDWWDDWNESMLSSANGLPMDYGRGWKDMYMQLDSLDS